MNVIATLRARTLLLPFAAALLLIGLGTARGVRAESANFTLTVTAPLSKGPHPITPVFATITNFTAYTGPFPYLLTPFCVSQSGNYTFTLNSPAVSNGLYVLTGEFSPSTGTPTTPLSNFIIFSQQLTNTVLNNVQIQGGVVHSALMIFSTGNSPVTLTITGPGQVTFGRGGCFVRPDKYVTTTASPSRVLVGDSVTVSAYAEGAVIPATIVFKNSGVQFASVATTDNTATTTFSASTVGRYRLTADFLSSSSLLYESIPADVEFTDGTGSVNVIEYENPSMGRVLYSSREVEQAALDSGARGNWFRTGSMFRAFGSSNAPAGVLSFCRGYSETLRGHIQSPNVSDCGNSGFVVQNPAQFVVIAPRSGACPLALTAYYQHIGPSTGAPHFRYLTSATTPADLAAQGWTSAGTTPTFCAMQR